MKANLMFRDKDFDFNALPCFGKEALKVDLELNHVLSAMAQGDEIIYAACSTALFCPLQSIEEITYRQQNLRDVLQNHDAIRKLYSITVETEKKRKSSWHWLSSTYLSSTFSSAVELMRIYTEMLMELRLVADNESCSF